MKEKERVTQGYGFSVRRRISRKKTEAQWGKNHASIDEPASP